MSYINSKPSVGVECGIKKRGVSVQMTDRLLEDLLPTAWAYICPWGKHRSAEHGAICGPGTSPRSLRTTALGSKAATAFWGSACLLGAQHGTMLPATLGHFCARNYCSRMRRSQTSGKCCAVHLHKGKLSSSSSLAVMGLLSHRTSHSHHQSLLISPTDLFL